MGTPYNGLQSEETPAEETPEVKEFKKDLLEDSEYLAELDEALKEFQAGKRKTLEEAESFRRKRRSGSR